ncbi:MFS transporter [Deinococcus sp. RIT780]|uniref:MFS transporter n=1 Tax=Deinococcus sp. RIT780 TaxID=2870472 RepID=UPI001C892BD4|nr:MFS transporter [Deinococcus sp. RIT780]MBX8464988.1 MFS transporter [Deinococcus sp. RIT780]
MSDAALPRPALNVGQLAPLYAAQALATGATTVSTVLASLIMSGLHFETLVGLPSTLISTSAALSAGAFGALMLRRGRRTGLSAAFTLGALGAAVGFVGARWALLPVFLIGACLMGAAQGGYQQARYAAAESVPDDRRGTALGALMLMSVLGSFLITGASRPIETLGAALGSTPEVAGWLVGGVLLGAAALLIRLWRPAALPAQTRAAPAKLTVREAFAIPGVRSTALALATAQGLMVTLMSLTPLRAHHMGMDHGAVAALISGHILGMFGFGWLTGPLIDRLGLRFGYVSGALLLAAAALSAPLSGAAWLAVSMFGLGLGWNLAFVAGSKSLTRFPAAQGVTDGLGYVAAGVGTALGGVIIARAGFPVLAGACAVLALLPLISAWRVRAA